MIYAFGGHIMMNDVATIERLDSIKKGCSWNIINPLNS